MIDDVDGLSLSANGLRIGGSLKCPAGGQHHVPKQAVILAKIHGGGQVPCLKCKNSLVLERIDS